MVKKDRVYVLLSVTGKGLVNHITGFGMAKLNGQTLGRKMPS